MQIRFYEEDVEKGLLDMYVSRETSSLDIAPELIITIMLDPNAPPHRVS